jgi:2-methylcitrate dehydratase PrpD
MTHSQTLATFAAQFRFDQIPTDVIRRTEDLFLDWYGLALAGLGARYVETIHNLAFEFGLASGPCEVLVPVAGASVLPPLLTVGSVENRRD